MNVVRRQHAQLGVAAGDRAAQFGGTQKIAVANDGDFSPPGNTDLWVVYWFVIDTFAGSGNVEMVNVSGGAVGTDGWFTFYDAPNHNLFMGSSDGSGYANLSTNPLALLEDKWYMAAFGWDNSGGGATYLMDLYDTGGLLTSVSTAGRFINNASPQPLNIGGGIDGQTWVQGRIDKLGLWALPSGQAPDVVALWNGGTGLTGAQVGAHGTLPTGLVDYYDLDEATGVPTWTSLSGTRNGTATGTVVSVPRAGFF